MVKLRLMLATAMVVGLSLVFAGSAFAAKASCGDCHGTHNGSAKTFDSTTSWHNLRSGYTPAIWEIGYTPVDADTCNNDGRGLHGVHVNYSSVSYGKKGGTSGVVRGNCDYCHKGKRHQDGFVNMSGSSVALVAGRQTSTAAGLSYDFGTKTCTNACHKSAAATAPWGNYTSASIHLTCSSCHGDASNYGPSASNTGLGNGSTGTAGHKVHLYSIGGTSHGNQLLGGTKIVLGSFSTVIDMNGNTDKVCAACHPDNMNDLWSEGRADDGTKKAYPHASDGTNVKAINASFVAPANIVFTNASGLADTTGKLSCTNACHSNKSAVQTADPKWNSTSGCELCHNHTPSAGVNISSTRPLTYAHALHFQMISTMEIGTGTVSRTDSTPTGNASCSDCHTDAHTINAVGGPQLYQLPVKDGAAGMDPAKVTWSAAGTIAVNGTCTNAKCHVIASPEWNSIPTNQIVGSLGCATCHEYPGTTRDWSGNNGHTIKNAATATRQLTHLRDNASYSATTDTYAGVTNDVNLCGKCHKGATHMSGTVNVADNNTLGLCDGTSFTFNATTPGSDVSCSNVKCHNGRTTPNWW